MGGSTAGLSGSYDQSQDSIIDSEKVLKPSSPKFIITPQKRTLAHQVSIQSLSEDRIIESEISSPKSIRKFQDRDLDIPEDEIIDSTELIVPERETLIKSSPVIIQTTFVDIVTDERLFSHSFSPSPRELRRSQPYRNSKHLPVPSIQEQTNEKKSRIRTALRYKSQNPKHKSADYITPNHNHGAASQVYPVGFLTAREYHRRSKSEQYYFDDSAGETPKQNKFSEGVPRSKNGHVTPEDKKGRERSKSTSPRGKSRVNDVIAAGLLIYPTPPAEGRKSGAPKLEIPHKSINGSVKKYFTSSLSPRKREKL
jgi:hypothetical protein